MRPGSVREDQLWWSGKASTTQTQWQVTHRKSGNLKCIFPKALRQTETDDFRWIATSSKFDRVVASKVLLLCCKLRRWAEYCSSFQWIPCLAFHLLTLCDHRSESTVLLREHGQREVVSYVYKGITALLYQKKNIYIYIIISAATNCVEMCCHAHWKVSYPFYDHDNAI